MIAPLCDVVDCRHWPWALLLCAMLFCGGAHAESGDVLYAARVPVAGTDAAARDQALSAALADVLVRASGNRKVAQHPALARVIQNAQRLVQRYSYENAPIPEPSPDEAVKAPDNTGSETAPAPETPAAPGLLLRAAFDPLDVERVLRAAGFTVWAAPRPQVLLWLAIEAGGEQVLVDEDAPLSVREALRTASARRGLPVLFPLLDLEDQGQLQFSDVTAGLAEHIVQASARYQPDAVLAGHLRETAPGQWTVRWTLYHHDTTQNWPAQGAITQVIDAGIDGAADVLARQTVPTGNDAGLLQLHVAGIVDLDRYADVERYLAGLAPVLQLHTLAVEADGATYALELRTTPAELQQAIAQGGLLLPESGESTGAVLRYRIAP